MKVINSKQCNTRVFINKETKKQTNFAGIIDVYDTKIYVDTRNGTGYDKVISKLKPLIHKLANKYHFSGNTREDTEQDIIVLILEGLPKYDPRRNTKLSTFIEMRVNRRLINEVRDSSIFTKNATFLNVATYQITCKCGETVILTLNKNEKLNRNCDVCGRSLMNSTKKLLVYIPEINGAAFAEKEEYDRYINSNQDFSSMFCEKPDECSAMFVSDLEKVLENEDPRVAKIIRLHCFCDYSIKAAAEQVGLTGAGGNLKLKKLAKNQSIKDILGR